MLSPESNVGIVCADSEALRGRVMVSGLKVLPPQEAMARGFQANSWGAIVPREPRHATDAELKQIAATPDTKHKIQLLEFPLTLKEKARQDCPPRERRILPDPRRHKEIIPGIEGVILEVRRDLPGSLTTSIDTRFISEATRRHPYTAMHIDAWPYEYGNIVYLIANLGDPTEPLEPDTSTHRQRSHLIAPTITRNALGNPEIKDMKEALSVYVQQQIKDGTFGEDDPIVYHIKLNGPRLNKEKKRLVLEGAAGTPVANILHDGSTRSSKQDSVAVMASIKEIEVGVFTSIV